MSSASRACDFAVPGVLQSACQSLHFQQSSVVAMLLLPRLCHVCTFLSPQGRVVHLLMHVLHPLQLHLHSFLVLQVNAMLLLL